MRSRGREATGRWGGQQRGFGWLGVGSKLKDACDKRHIIVRWYRNLKHEKHFSFMGLNAVAYIG